MAGVVIWEDNFLGGHERRKIDARQDLHNQVQKHLKQHPPQENSRSVHVGLTKIIYSWPIHTVTL